MTLALCPECGGVVEYKAIHAGGHMLWWHEDETAGLDHEPNGDDLAVIPLPDSGIEPGQICEWFAMCGRMAAARVFHPVLGSVPICAPCRARNERLAAR